MAADIILPKLGMDMQSGTIMTWYKNEGDTVKKGEPLFELMTDKSTMEFPCPQSGTLLKILVECEEDYDCGTPICIIGEEGEDISGLL